MSSSKELRELFQLWELKPVQATTSSHRVLYERKPGWQCVSRTNLSARIKCGCSPYAFGVSSMAEFSQSKTSENLNKEIQSTIQDHNITLIKTARLSNNFKFSYWGVTWQKKKNPKQNRKQQKNQAQFKCTQNINLSKSWRVWPDSECCPRGLDWRKCSGLAPSASDRLHLFCRVLGPKSPLKSTWCFFGINYFPIYSIRMEILWQHIKVESILVGYSEMTLDRT